MGMETEVRPVRRLAWRVSKAFTEDSEAVAAFWKMNLADLGLTEVESPTVEHYTEHPDFFMEDQPHEMWVLTGKAY